MLVKTKTIALRKDGKMRFMETSLTYDVYINGREWDSYPKLQFTKDYVEGLTKGYNMRRVTV